MPPAVDSSSSDGGGGRAAAAMSVVILLFVVALVVLLFWNMLPVFPLDRHYHRHTCRRFELDDGDAEEYDNEPAAKKKTPAVPKPKPKAVVASNKATSGSLSAARDCVAIYAVPSRGVR